MSSFSVKSQEVGRNKKEMKLFECLKCGVVFAEDYLEDKSGIYGDFYATWGKDLEDKTGLIAEAKKRSFRHQLKSLTRFINPSKKKILDVGTGGGFFLEEAKKAGFDCFGLDISPFACGLAKKNFGEKIFCGTIEEANYPDSFFDAVCLLDVLEHISNPKKIIQEIWRITKPGGLLFIVSPNHNSLSRKVFGRNWFQYKHEHVFYFNKNSFQIIAQKNGFDLEIFKLNIKNFSIGYYQQYFKKYKMKGFAKIFLFLSRFMPEWLLKLSLPNPITGEFLAIAKKRQAPCIFGSGKQKIIMRLFFFRQ